VLKFPSGISFMDGGATVTELFNPYDFWAQEFSFTIHGNPMGAPYQVTGKFAKQTAVETC
jgi:hypothetical protein